MKKEQKKNNIVEQNININNVVDSIDVVEFYKDDDGDYNSILVDQLYNLPSIISSKENVVNFFSSKMDNINIDNLYLLDRISKQNSATIMSETIINSVLSNYTRFIGMNVILNSLNVNINPSGWINAKSNNFNFDNEYNFLYNIFISLFNRDIFCYLKDSDEEIKNSRNMISLVASQIYINISSTIAFDLNKQIDANRDMVIKNYNNLKLYYKEHFDSMSQLFNTLAEGDAAMLFVKQILSLELYTWFDNSLSQLILDDMDQLYKLNYYLYDSMIKETKQNGITKKSE